MRTRDRAAGLDFSEVLSEEVESEMKEAAAISMGTDISESDILNILALCEQARCYQRAPAFTDMWSLYPNGARRTTFGRMPSVVVRLDLQLRHGALIASSSLLHEIRFWHQARTCDHARRLAPSLRQYRFQHLLRAASI